jgi:hypothetical protein
VGHFRAEFLEALGTDWAFEATDGDTIVTVDGLLFFYVSSGAAITVQGGKLKVESNEVWSRLQTGLRAVVGDDEVLARLEAGLASKFIITAPKSPEEAGLVAAGNVDPADDPCVLSEGMVQSLALQKEWKACRARIDDSVTGGVAHFVTAATNGGIKIKNKEQRWGGLYLAICP